MKLPWRRERKARVLNPAVLINDTDTLAGDELIDIGDGRKIRVADLLAGKDVIEVVPAPQAGPIGHER